MSFINGIKYVDLPLQIGRSNYDLGIGGFLSRSIDDAYNKMELELGSTYYFAVYYFNHSLTRNNVPYYPIKLSILDVNNSSDINNSVHSDELMHDYFCLDSLLIQFQNNEPITNKVIFNVGISGMVLHSDLIKNIVDSDYQKAIGSIDCSNPVIVGISRNYVLNLSLVYFKSVV